MLAAAWQKGTLFDMDAINWGFIRPRKPTDRAQAYAQGRWMIEFVERTYGWEPLRKLLFSYAEGIKEDEAMRRAFGVGRAEFFARFTKWAGDEVRAWGLDPKPSMRELALRLRSGEYVTNTEDTIARKARAGRSTSPGMDTGQLATALENARVEVE